MPSESCGDVSDTRADHALFQLSVPKELLDRIKREAKNNERSANREIVYALRQRYEVVA